jgi:uracil-DNA glycosylase
MQYGKEFWVKQLGVSWAEALKPVLKTEKTEKLINSLVFNYAFATMYPKEKKDIFKAFRLCPFDNLKIVIISTEPSMITGVGPLAFSDEEGSYINPCALQIKNSVARYKKELYLDFDTTFEHWANQGILMLNRSLTCQKDKSKTHKEDWKQFFGMVLYSITLYKPGTIFLLWGKDARKYSEVLSKDHHVFSWEHPMAANNKFKEWDCPNFKQVDNLLAFHGKEQIQW